MEEVKKYTQEELENLSREEFIKVIIEITKRNEQLTEELDKVKADKSHCFLLYMSEQKKAAKAEAALAAVSKQRDAAISAIAELAYTIADLRAKKQ